MHWQCIKPRDLHLDTMPNYIEDELFDDVCSEGEVTLCLGSRLSGSYFCGGLQDDAVVQQLQHHLNVAFFRSQVQPVEPILREGGGERAGGRKGGRQRERQRERWREAVREKDRKRKQSRPQHRFL